MGAQLSSGSISLVVFSRRRWKDDGLGGGRVMEIFCYDGNEEGFRQVTNDFPRGYMELVIPLMNRVAT